MFVLGILGILQVLIIPGLIFIRSIKLETRFIANVMAVITTSLVINYCLVFLLTVLHVYSRILMFLIIACELGVIIWKYRYEFNQPIESWLEKIKKSINEFFKKWVDYFQNNKEPSTLFLFAKITYIGFCLILAYIALNWIWKLFLWNLGSVFNSYDTIAIWNRWAISWANNTLPSGTWRYPQLLPTNWSIIYMMLGDTSIQFFAKAIMPLFTLFILLMIVDLGFAKKNAGFLLGATITYLTIKKFLGPFVIEGLADLPSAFFAFAAIYFLVIFQNDHCFEFNKKEYAVLIAISAAGAAITKQVGLVFLALFIIVFSLFFLRPLSKESKNKALEIICITAALVFIIVVPWYFYKQVMIWQGNEYSEVRMIVSATENAFQSASITTWLMDISKMLGKYFFLLVLIIALSFFVEPMIRAINLFLILPLFISWSVYASYDFRNLAIALPIFGMSSGISVQYIINFFFRILRKIPFAQIVSKYILMLLLVITAIIGFFIFPDEFLRTKQTEQVMNTFAPSINRKLISALEDVEGDFTIMTNYPLDNLPGMAGKKIPFLFNNFKDYQFILSYAEIEYLLVPKYADQDIMDDISEKIQNGEYTLVFEDDSWIPYQFIQIVKRQ